MDNVIQNILTGITYLCLAFLAGMVFWGIIWAILTKLFVPKTEWKDE